MANGPLAHPQFAPDDRSVEVTHQAHPGVHAPDKPDTRTVSRDLPFLMDGDFLQVRNDDKMPVEFAWGGTRYLVQPNETAFVIFEAVVNKLGDPRSVYGDRPRFDAKQHPTNGAKGGQAYIPERYEELVRLFAMYGVEEERQEDFTRDDGTVVQGLVSKVPLVTVTTLTGQPVYFPAQRPKGLSFPVPNAKQTISSDVSRELEQLRTENAGYEERIQRLEASLNAKHQVTEGYEPEPET